MKICVIPQSQLRAEAGATQQAARDSIFRKMIRSLRVAEKGAVDLAEQRISLDQGELSDLYESARRLQPGCNNLEMPLEDVGRILSRQVTWFEVRILLQMLSRSRSAVLSMIPDNPQSSDNGRRISEISQLLTVWFRP